MQFVTNFLLVVVVTMAIVVAFGFGNRRLVGYFEGRPHLKFRRQLIQLAGVLVAVLFLILFLPLGDTLRGQLLSLYGLIISATIALSSTTLVGNIMAGIMLKTIGSCRPGNYITVGDYFGRITEMDLMHTEIQTEERDLTTLPNLYLVTHPVRVMRSSGTVLFVELSLGYDVPRHSVEELLIDAAKDVGLESPYVQIRNLGDYSVTYRISGLLSEVNRLLDRRRALRAKTMDALHAAGIEIVSPTFMNTRSFETDRQFIAAVRERAATQSTVSTDALVFDKAEKAESVSRLREKLEEAQARLKVCKDIADDDGNPQAAAAAAAECEGLEERIDRLKSLIDRKEAKISSE
ncbi:MAG: mechanosensitive ion channel domain-containing protein [Pseudomonadota bacterium]